MDTKILTQQIDLNKIIIELINEGNSFPQALLIFDIVLTNLLMGELEDWNPQVANSIVNAYLKTTKLLCPYYLNLSSASPESKQIYSKITDPTLIAKILTQPNQLLVMQSFVSKRLAMHQELNFLNSYTIYRARIKSNA